MDAVRELFGTLTTMQWRDILDIVLVTYLIYRVVLLVRTTASMRIFKGIIAILVVSALTQIWGLRTLNTGTVRVSFGWNSTEEEAEKLLLALGRKLA